RGSKSTASIRTFIPKCTVIWTPKSASICASKRPRTESRDAGERRDCFSARPRESEDAEARHYRILCLNRHARFRVRPLSRPNSKRAELRSREAHAKAAWILRLRAGQDKSRWQCLRRVDGVRPKRGGRGHHRRPLFLVE